MKRIAVLGGYLVALLILFIRCTPKDNKPITYNDEVFTRCDTTPATVLAQGLPIHLSGFDVHHGQHHRHRGFPSVGLLYPPL